MKLKKLFAVLLLPALFLFCLVSCSEPSEPVAEEAFDARYQDWQSYLKDDAKLTNIVIPGSHDAGAAALDGSSASIADGFLMCQKLSLYYQLISGSRYFDLRTMLSDGELYLQHGDYKVQKFSTAIDDIKKYLAEHSDFLVLNFQHFTDDAAAEETYSVLANNFDLQSLCVTTDKTLGELDMKYIRESGKRLIIIWGRATIPDASLFFEKASEYLYSPYDGDIHSAGDDELLAHFATYIAGSAQYSGFFNLQCQRTWGSNKLLSGPEALEENFGPKANEYLSALNGADLEAINIVHRDFIDPDKCGVILRLNLKKNLVKDEYKDKF